MELWIRSQDKLILTKINHVDAYEGSRGWLIYGYYTNDIDREILGTYKTKKRALEVLDEIQELILVKINIGGSYNEIDLQLKSCILSNMAKIYEMPEE